ncbi:lectin MOA-related protein [Dehalococcoides mccartyi]|uniref:lectin MOA-related protein n=1 Tax=Dehalococcoides mccartyi TaxID=61435 RepID=UPI0007501B64|nr:lectin MOA-related protein [Dehalococcoides mccartyi]
MKQFIMTAEEAFSILHKLHVKTIMIDDELLYYLSEEEWLPILKEASANLPQYQPDRFDCEDFAISMIAYIAQRYRLNSCGMARGESPGGYHAWNVILTEHGPKFFEPQTGTLFEFNGGGYSADMVYFG